MMEKVPTVVEKTAAQYYPPHLKKVLRTYQKSAIKSLQGPSTVLSTETIGTSKKEAGCGCSSSVSESSPELHVGRTPTPTPPPLPPSSQAPIPQVPILSTADQSAELSRTIIEGNAISCFIIGGEKRICFVQLLSTALRNVQPYTINNVTSDLFINFSACSSDQLSALKEEGLLPPETATCGLVTKPDAERLCSVLLHEGVVAPDSLEKQAAFLIYHECFSGAKGVLYYEFFSAKNWCVQCFVCRRLFAPQLFVIHSCYMDKKRNTIHPSIETGICHWGFESANWKLYLHVLEEQPNYEKYTEILDEFKKQHQTSDLPVSLKRKLVVPAESNEVDKTKVATDESVTTGVTTSTTTSTATIKPKIERVEVDEEEERWYMKKKAKMAESAPIEDGPPVPSMPSYYGSFHSYYSNLCDAWVRNAAYHHAATWPTYPPFPLTKESKTYYFTDSVPFLAQDPPVLLHPERVVPLSQSEQFERSYQPNVALAPPTKTSDGVTYSKLKSSVIRVKSDMGSPPGTPIQDTGTSSTILYLGRGPKSDKMLEVKTQPRSSSASPASTSAEPVQDNGVNSVVEQVAAVLDALSDAEDAVRQRVISLVQRLTQKIDLSDIESQKYRDEIAKLQLRISELEEENVRLFCDNSLFRRQLDDKVEEKDATLRPPSPSLVNNNASYLYPSNRNTNTPGISPKQPICSPVSVITSPPPSLSVIRSESAA